MSGGESPDGIGRLRSAGAIVGEGVRARLGEDFAVEPGAVIGDGAVLVADRGRIGAGARIGAGCDLRSGSLRIGADSEVGERSRVLVADEFAIGAASRIEADVDITCRRFTAGNLFYFGHSSSVGYGGTTASTAVVEIGSRVALGPGTVLNANRRITLGDQVGSGCNLSVWTHGYHFGHRLLDGYEAAYDEVRVDANVWLGFHVTLLPGVGIGANTVVAAGAVVARDLPADVLAAGVPAVAKRRLDPRPPTGAEAERRIAGLLGEWTAELEWKGLTARLTSPTEVDMPGHRAELVAADREAGPDDGRTRLLLTVEDRPDLRGAANAVVFELRSGGLHGDLDPVAHDLRDFLRRNALPCGEKDTFRSLPPVGFARLRDPELPGERP